MSCSTCKNLKRYWPVLSLTSFALKHDTFLDLKKKEHYIFNKPVKIIERLATGFYCFFPERKEQLKDFSLKTSQGSRL